MGVDKWVDLPPVKGHDMAEHMPVLIKKGK
jgi:hypothetical protein